VVGFWVPDFRTWTGGEPLPEDYLTYFLPVVNFFSDFTNSTVLLGTWLCAARGQNKRRTRVMKATHF
jgi:hypothetical protein